MLEKFITIKNIGRFRNCNPRGNVAFQKLTLLFAENGRGKTTLCAIMRSLRSGQSAIISERKTLGTNDPASVRLRLGGTNITYDRESWSTTYPDMTIFDSVFIHENVYAGDYVDHEHRKNLYRVVVGEQGVDLARLIDELDGKIRDANKDIKEKRDAVSRYAPTGITVETYLDWQPIADIEIIIEGKSKEIGLRQRALENAAEIQSKPLLATLALPSLPSNFGTVLSKQLADISADAEAHVKEQVTAHAMGNSGEAWLSQGLHYVVDEKCPFCGQGVHSNDLIAAYRSHFNSAYKALKNEVSNLQAQINTAIGDGALGNVQQTLSNNATLAEFWRQFAAMDLPSFPIEEARDKYAALRSQAVASARQKQQSPIEPIGLDHNLTAAIHAVAALQEQVNAYNDGVARINVIIQEKKVAAQNDGDLTALQQDLARLNATKMRFEPNVVQACQEYREKVATKADLQQEKDSAKRQLDQHCETILAAYETSINEYLDQFNAGFRITNSGHRYTGGTPSSHYQISISDNSVELGDSRTPPGTPCFKTALSSGDRSALALAFFLAALKQDSNLSNKIVVLDDPFTSQDRFRRTCTQQLICQLASAAHQVLVLSHDPHFLRLIWDGHSRQNISVLQLLNSAGGTVIGEWDVELETQSDYLKNYSTLLEFYRERKGTPLGVARAIRPFLEGMLRAHFPGHFQPEAWLGEFICKIRSTSESDGLSHAKADLAEIEAINDYSKRYHHEQNPNASSEALSEEELHGFVKRTLRLVGGAS